MSWKIFKCLSRSKEVEDDAQQGDQTDTPQADLLMQLKESKTLQELMDKLKEAAGDDSFAALEQEAEACCQSYEWITKMEKRYGKAWRQLFQAAQMPVDQEEFGKMRSLITEIALHTIDFCRYRTGYINLSEEMKVNPTMMLEGKSIQEAGGVALNANPYHINREVRVLSQLMDHDGISIKNATIHGYYQENINAQQI